MELAEIIRRQRGERTQEQFAQELGCSRQTVVWWETGKFVPSKTWLDRLGITINYGTAASPENTENADLTPTRLHSQPDSQGQLVERSRDDLAAPATSYLTYQK